MGTLTKQASHGMVPVHCAPVVRQTSHSKLEQFGSFSKHKRECSKFISRISAQSLSTTIAHGAFASSFDYDDYSTDEDIEDDASEIIEMDHYMPTYSYGKRWYYWDHYKQDERLYVHAVWKNFREELLNNNLYQVFLSDFNGVKKKAQFYYKSQRAKALQATGNLVSPYLGAQYRRGMIKV